LTKKRVNQIDVERRYDYFIVREKDGAKHTIYADDYDKIVKILMEIDEMAFKDNMVTPESMATKLCEMHPELKTKMLRPTGRYYNLYHLVLKILDYYRYIDYHKDGTIKKHKKFVDITPIKRGLDRWM